MPLKVEVIDQIATTLGETEEKPLHQIKRIVKRCGTKRALAWLEETQNIEKNGGIMTRDGSRRRTPGGVYFYIVREQLRNENRWKLMSDIFGPPGGQSGMESLPPATWTDRGDLQAKISEEDYGDAGNIRVTVVGKATKIVEKQYFTLLMINHTGPLPALPKGIPVPTRVPTTTYVVYIGGKQWRKLKDSLRNREDTLIIEGTQFWDTDYEAMAVFAIKVTTRILEQSLRQKQKAEADDIE